MIGSLSAFRRRLLHWYHRHRRDLLWRPPKNAQKTRGGAATAQAGAVAVDPYHVLVSELMLQQTQVTTVIPYFRRFIERFGTIGDLAAADEQEVLRLWQGLGYYSRARNLHRAAKEVVARFGGTLPDDVERLLELPGVGRYTAGAIASIAFGRRAPILDGNVMRVLCRLDAVRTDPRERATQEVLWARALEVLPAKQIGEFNSGLMELGATVCTPRAPQCLLCPVREYCQAFALRMQKQIPPAKKTKPTPLFHRWVFCIHRGDRWLIEQRPEKRRWAGMWQFMTVEAGPSKPTATTVAKSTGIRVMKLRPLGQVRHALTHRHYEFDVFACTTRTDVTDRERLPTAGRWVTLDELGAFPLPKPHVTVAAMLRQAPA